MMKAVVYHEYGSPDVFSFANVDLPSVKDDEVLVHVRASSVNPWDWHFMRGSPIVARMVSGLRKPRQPILGADVAGRVEAVGRNVTQFHPGDEVYAFVSSSGCFAEYVSVPASIVGHKPTNLTFEQAAAVPLAGLTALQSLRDQGRIEPGMKVLINGSSGGVGSFGVQIAKSFGAEVTAVCSARNAGMVRELGADHVVDYQREDFTRSGQRYDVLMDTVGNRRLSESRRVLEADGVVILIAGLQPMTDWIGIPRMWVRVLAARTAWRQKVIVFPIVQPSGADLRDLKDLIESGQVTPHIDRTYPLSDVPEAIRYLEQGHARGKVAIAV